VIDDTVRQFSHPNVDESKHQPFFTAVMFVDSRKTDSGFVSNVTNGCPMKVRAGKDLENSLFESPVYVAV
jgi:hypothetical protein